jgi:hypothetical protein
MDEFYQNLTDIYGADPRVVESLVPPPLFPAQISADDPSLDLPLDLSPLPPPDTTTTTSSTSTSSSSSSSSNGGKESERPAGEEEESSMMTHILESITIAFENKKRADDRLAAMTKDEKEHPPGVKMRMRSPTASPVKHSRKQHVRSEEMKTAAVVDERDRDMESDFGDSDDDDDDEEDDEEEEGATDLAAVATMQLEGESSASSTKEGDEGGEEDDELAVISNDTQAR